MTSSAWDHQRTCFYIKRNITGKEQELRNESSFFIIYKTEPGIINSKEMVLGINRRQYESTKSITEKVMIK